MAIWSSLTTHFAVNMVDSDPRNARVTGIQNHHTATNNKMVVLALFAPGGRTVTPNYFVAGKEVWGIVPEDRRAYTSGSPYDDHRAVTIETLNLTNAPDWRFAADTIATVILLNADIARRYGITPRHALAGIYEHRNIYSWTGRSYATACAGPSFSINQIIAGAAAALAPKPAPAPEPEPEITKEQIMAFKSIGIGYRPDPKADRVITTGLDFEDGQRLSEVAMTKDSGISFFEKITEGSFAILSEGHYKKVVAEFDEAVKEKRAHELAVARASAGDKK